MKIIIADDDNIIREGLKMIISSQPDFEIVGVGANGAEAVDAEIVFAEDTDL